jgi:hypothetical protein
MRLGRICSAAAWPCRWPALGFCVRGSFWTAEPSSLKVFFALAAPPGRRDRAHVSAYSAPAISVGETATWGRSTIGSNLGLSLPSRAACPIVPVPAPPTIGLPLPGGEDAARLPRAGMASCRPRSREGVGPRSTRPSRRLRASMERNRTSSDRRTVSSIRDLSPFGIAVRSASSSRYARASPVLELRDDMAMLEITTCRSSRSSTGSSSPRSPNSAASAEADASAEAELPSEDAAAPGGRTLKRGGTVAGAAGVLATDDARYAIRVTPDESASAADPLPAFATHSPFPRRFSSLVGVRCLSAWRWR